MYERVKTVFKAMITALTGKLESPEEMLDGTYSQLQSALIAVRQELALALAREGQLKESIEHLKRNNASAEETKERLKHLQEEIPKLRQRIEDLENQIQRTHTKKQALIGTHKATNATLVCEEILVGKAITEDGATFDRELAPAPSSGPNYALILVLLVVAMLIVIVWRIFS